MTINDDLIAINEALLDYERKYGRVHADDVRAMRVLYQIIEEDRRVNSSEGIGADWDPDRFTAFVDAQADAYIAQPGAYQIVWEGDETHFYNQLVKWWDERFTEAALIDGAYLPPADVKESMAKVADFLEGLGDPDMAEYATMLREEWKR